MHFIVGLGNPGKEFEGTRHNIGFTVLESFVGTVGLPSLHESGKYSGRTCVGLYADNEVSLLLPSTFMNLSGVAVAKLVLKGETEKLIVVYDDIDLPFGEIKISYGRGAGGHNGIKSIIETLGTQDFTRVRIGIAQKSLFTGNLKRPKGDALAHFVLAPFTKKEEKEVEVISKTVEEILKTFVSKGKEVAMNRFN